MINLSKNAGGSEFAKRIKRWVREYAVVPEDFAILVTELKCTEPGCPPLETVIALLGPNGQKCQQKVHLPLNQITRSEAEKLSEKLKLQLNGGEIGEEHSHA